MKKTLLAGIASLALIVPAAAQTTPPSSGATQGSQGQTSPQMNRPTGSGSTSTTTDTGRPAMQQQTQSPSTTTPPSTAQSPSTTTPPSTAQTPSSGSSPSVAQGSTGGAGPYMNAPMQGQFMVSNLMDRTVYGSDGNSVGDVNDVVMDSNGNIAAVVIGVGGFLGIGEKDVAVPFNRLQVVHQQGRDGASGTSSAPSSSSGQTSATGGQTSGAGPGGTGQQSTAQSPTPPTSGTSGMSGSSSFWANFSDDSRLVLNATREELRNAPTFRARGDRGTAGTTGTSGQPTTNR